MRLLRSIALLAASSLVSAASWSFEDATISVAGKSSGNVKEAIKPDTPLKSPITLSSDATLKLLLTTTNGGKGRQAHQAFLTISHPNSNLADSFPLTTKESGKSTVSISFKDIPAQLLRSQEPLDAEIVIGSFGSSKPYKNKAFKLKIEHETSAPLPKEEEVVRYGKKEEIHHIFRSDPKSPPKIVTLVFTAGVLAALPLLLIVWGMLGGNLSHLSKAMSASPLSHALFVGSIFAMEGLFFLYYTSWNLFEVLPVAAAIGVVAFYSGSRALSEVQERRLAGLR